MKIKLATISLSLLWVTVLAALPTPERLSPPAPLPVTRQQGPQQDPLRAQEVYRYECVLDRLSTETFKRKHNMPISNPVTQAEIAEFHRVAAKYGLTTKLFGF